MNPIGNILIDTPGFKSNVAFVGCDRVCLFTQTSPVNTKRQNEGTANLKARVHKFEISSSYCIGHNNYIY